MQTPTTDNKPSIFILGATDFIGGAFLTKLLESPDASRWNITVLTHSKDSFPIFKNLGVTPLFGALDDVEVLTKASSDADVVLNFADADHLASIKSIVAGLSAGGKRRILNEVKGEYASDKIYNDLDIGSINSILATKPHRIVDDYIFKNSAGFESIIVALPLIYGREKGPFKKNYIQISLLIRGFIKSGYAATIGKGANVWNNVHVENLADFYLLLLQKAWEAKASIDRDEWYFVESGEHVWKDVVIEIGKQLYKQGAIKQEETREFTKEEVDKFLGEMGWYAISNNSRSKAD